MFDSNLQQNLDCPAEIDGGGPLISLVKSEKQDSLSIVWMSIDKSDMPVDGYRIYLNDKQFGPKVKYFHVHFKVNL